jgi:hypothetical protein
MSVSQPILEHLQHSCDSAESLLPFASATLQELEQTSLRHSQLGYHASWYRENLGQCNEPMLQYEWAWMHGRIATLRNCCSAGRANAGEARTEDGSELSESDPRLAQLLLQSQLFRTLLLQEFCSRGLKPMPPRGTVVACEEAWEITSTAVRQEWGIL